VVPGGSGGGILGNGGCTGLVFWRFFLGGDLAIQPVCARGHWGLHPKKWGRERHLGVLDVPHEPCPLPPSEDGNG